MKLKSIIKCPKCGFEKEETMLTDSCQIFYECPNCKTVLTPIQGDCCVFCFYGDVPCPPKQNDWSPIRANKMASTFQTILCERG